MPLLQKLIDRGMGATVLIHEATFEHGLLDHAVNKNHSTTDEAVLVGKVQFILSFVFNLTRKYYVVAADFIPFKQVQQHLTY
jgi:hypothetical protein